MRISEVISLKMEFKMKKIFMAMLLPLFIASCTGKYHDTQIHQKCSHGPNNYKSSVKKHLDCQDELRAKQSEETNADTN